MILDNICEFIIDCEHKTAPTQENGYPSIRTPNIGRGHFILDGVNRVSEETYKEWTKRGEPTAGDLILAREAPVGNVAVVPKNARFCLGQRTVLIRPKQSVIDPYYLCYLLLSPNIRADLLAKSGGATVHHLNLKDIRALPIPTLPTLIQQKRLSLVIKNYYDLIQTNQQRIALLEEAAQRLYDEWFVKLRFPNHEQVSVVEGVPEGWEIKKIGDIIPFQYGKSLKADSRIEGEYPVYGSSGIVGYHNQALISANCIIVGRKGNAGSVFFSSPACFPIDTVFYIEPSKNNFYFYFFLKGLVFVDTDSAVPGLNRSYAHNLDVIIPESNLLKKFTAEAELLFEQMNTLEKQNQKLTQARDELLPRLMSGQLDISKLT